MAVAIDAVDVDLLYQDAGVRTLTRRLAGEDYALAMPLAQAGLRDELNVALERLEAKGRVTQLWQKWAEAHTKGD